MDQVDSQLEEQLRTELAEMDWDGIRLPNMTDAGRAFQIADSNEEEA